MKSAALIFALVLACGALSACGGGAGGDGFYLLTPAQEEAISDAAFAMQRPAEGAGGGVSQSTNSDGAANPATAGGTSVNFDNVGDTPPARFTIMHSGAGAGWTLRLTIEDLTVADGDYNSGLLRLQYPGGRLIVQAIIGGGGAEDDAAALLADINSGDWLALGLWMFLPPDAGSDDFALGVFADGGMLVEHAVNTGGESEYAGFAEGLLIGADREMFFAGAITLTADFSDTPVVSGRINNIMATRGGDPVRPVNMVLDLREAAINNGFFRGALTAENTPGGGEYSDVRGSWGGNFSHGDAARPDDAPDFAAGTFGGKGGSGVNLLGVFQARCRLACAPAP